MAPEVTQRHFVLSLWRSGFCWFFACSATGDTFPVFIVTGGVHGHHPPETPARSAAVFYWDIVLPYVSSNWH